MQGTDTFHNGGFPSSQGRDVPTPDVASQLRSQRRRHLRILLLRTVRFWWYHILLVVLGGYMAANLGQSALNNPMEVLGGIVMLPLFFLALRRF